MLVATATPDPDPPPIASLVAQYTELRPSGADQLRGVCPFCGDTAFRVRPPHGTFHCFGCGAGGNARMFTEMITP